MINKNLKLLVLGLASFGMVACGGGQGGQSGQQSTPASEPASTPASTPAEDLPPVVDGKITVYFEFKASEGVSSFETWTSPFIDGFFNSWNANPGVELVKYGETNLYYAQVEMDYEGNATDPGYQLCLGYNDASGVGDSLKGIASYSYKSDYCTTFSGLSHPTMNAPVDGRIKLVGDGVEYQTWSKQPVQPIILEDYHVYFDASLITDAPDYVTGTLIKGSFNGWESKALRAPTAEEIAANGDLEGKLIADMGDVFANTPIEFCIGPSTAAITAVEDAYRFESETQKLPANMSCKPLKMDGNHAYVPYAPKLTLPEGYEWPAEPKKLGADITVTLQNTGTAGFGEGISAGLIGLDGNWTEDVLFTEVDGELQATIPGENRYVGSTMEFKVRAAGSWTGSAGAEAGNISLTVLDKVTKMTISIDYSKLGVEDQIATVDYHAAVIEGLTFILVDVDDEPAEDIATAPYIAGTLNGWSHEAFTKDEEGNYTYTSTETFYEGDNVSFKITSGEWNGIEVYDAETDSNFSITLIEGCTNVYVGFSFAEFTAKTPGGVIYGVTEL